MVPLAPFPERPFAPLPDMVKVFKCVRYEQYFGDNDGSATQIDLGAWRERYLYVACGLHSAAMACSCRHALPTSAMHSLISLLATADAHRTYSYTDEIFCGCLCGMASTWTWVDVDPVFGVTAIVLHDSQAVIVTFGNTCVV